MSAIRSATTKARSSSFWLREKASSCRVRLAPRSAAAMPFSDQAATLATSSGLRRISSKAP